MILGSAIAPALAGPFVAACALLVVAGAGKLARPAPARLAANAAGLRVSRFGILAFGLVEVGLGAAAAVVGGVVAYGVAACYLGLTFVAVRLLQRAPTTPCACLGSPTAVVTRTHVAVDVAAALVAVGAATGGSPWLLLADRWLPGAVFVVLVVTCVKLAMLALETLPTLTSAAEDGTT